MLTEKEGDSIPGGRIEWGENTRNQIDNRKSKVRLLYNTEKKENQGVISVPSSYFIGSFQGEYF